MAAAAGIPRCPSQRARRLTVKRFQCKAHRSLIPMHARLESYTHTLSNEIGDFSSCGLRAICSCRRPRVRERQRVSRAAVQVLLVVWLLPPHRLARLDLAGGAVARQTPCSAWGMGSQPTCVSSQWDPRTCKATATPSAASARSQGAQCAACSAAYHRNRSSTLPQLGRQQNNIHSPFPQVEQARSAGQTAVSSRLTVFIHKPHLLLHKAGPLAVVIRAHRVEVQYCSNAGWAQNIAAGWHTKHGGRAQRGLAKRGRESPSACCKAQQANCVTQPSLW